MKTKQNWPELITEFHNSGKSKIAFCKDRGVSYQSFLMHLKRTHEGVQGGFQEIVLQGTTSSDRIEFHFPDGRIVSFPITTPKDTIRFLVNL